MAIEPTTQTINQIKDSSNILILLSSGSNADTVSASLALKEFITRQDKRAQIITSTPLIPKLEFLPTAESLKQIPTLAKNLVVEVSLQKTKLSELNYQKSDEKLSIFLTPKVGEFESGDVVVKSAAYPFDLIITIGIASLSELGEIYSKHAQMFFDIPVLNIDYKASNENYGQINYVNLTNSSVSEAMFDLLSAYDSNFIDEKIATLLLAGLVAQTNSFQSQKTTPQVFLKASKLVSLGGKQQEIVTQLYRSKSMGILRLWGRVLARLKHIPATQLVYSVVSGIDIEKSEANLSDLDEIIFEMMQQLSFAKNFLFLSEASGKVIVYVAGSGPINFYDLFSQYNPTSIASTAYKFEIARQLIDVETEIVAVIQREYSKFQS